MFTGFNAHQDVYGSGLIHDHNQAQVSLRLEAYQAERYEDPFDSLYEQLDYICIQENTGVSFNSGVYPKWHSIDFIDRLRSAGLCQTNASRALDFCEAVIGFISKFDDAEIGRAFLLRNEFYRAVREIQTACPGPTESVRSANILAKHAAHEHPVKDWLKLSILSHSPASQRARPPTAPPSSATANLHRAEALLRALAVPHLRLLCAFAWSSATAAARRCDLERGDLEAGLAAALAAATIAACRVQAAARRVLHRGAVVAARAVFAREATARRA